MDKEKQKNANSEDAQNSKDQNQQNISNEMIIDLGKLVGKVEIENSDVILAIIEICTFNKRYNYDCSNNTKAFWERVVQEEILKKIFRNFKSETLRKYWKIIRLTGNSEKFIEVVKQNEEFINNPVFKLLPIINGISSYIQANPDKQNFEEYFISLNPKEKKVTQKEDFSYEKESFSPVRPKILKKKKVIEDTEESEKEVDPKMLKLDDIINKIMKISKYSREEVFKAFYGTSGNIKNTYLYLMDKLKYEKYCFKETDDYIIKNMKEQKYFKELLESKGEELIKERETFLGIKKKTS